MKSLEKNKPESIDPEKDRYFPVLAEGETMSPEDFKKFKDSLVPKTPPWLENVDLKNYPRYKVSFEESMEICEHLEDAHSLFRTFWDMGSPVIVNSASLPTACIAFDRKGNETAFLFNGPYFDYLTPYERSFICGHEMLHVLFSHGKRMLLQRYDQLSNMAMDVVVNHTLCDDFGFDRDKLRNWKDLCWVDTCFPEKKFGKVPTGKSYEYYYNLMKENTTFVEIKMLTDEHSMDGEPQDGMTANDHGSISEDLANYVDGSQFDKNLKDAIEKHGEDHDDSKPKNKAGKGIGKWINLTVNRIKKINKKWEEVISSWKKKTLVYDFNEFDSFIHENRRFMDFLNEFPDIALETEVEFEDYYYDKKAVEIWFYLDTSGSCISYKDRFFAASQTLDANKFQIKLMSFDTVVKDVDIEKKNIYGGGGTAFDIIETDIQSKMKRDNCDYPDCVFVITDGAGNSVYPQYPERWHWFLTDGYSTDGYIPAECKKYQLADFE